MCKNKCVCYQLLTIECLVQNSAKESNSFDRDKTPLVNKLCREGLFEDADSFDRRHQGDVLIDIDPQVNGK